MGLSHQYFTVIWTSTTENQYNYRHLDNQFDLMLLLEDLYQIEAINIVKVYIGKLEPIIYEGNYYIDSFNVGDLK